MKDVQISTVTTAAAKPTVRGEKRLRKEDEVGMG
jgi:hypothetical protein